MAIARSGWCCLWVSPRYRIEDDRVTFSRSPLALPMLALIVVGLIIVDVYYPGDHGTFWSLWWGCAIAAIGAFGAMSATWFPGRVVITPGAVEWAGHRYPRAEITALTATGLISRMRGHVGTSKTTYLEVTLTSRKVLLMQLASTQFLQGSTARRIDEVLGAAQKIFLRTEGPAAAAPVPHATAPAPALMPRDVAAIAIGARVYRVRPGVANFDADVIAFENDKQVARATVSLPNYFQLGSATLAVRGADIVIDLVAFHCKDDSGFDGTWVIDAACKTQSKTW